LSLKKKPPFNSGFFSFVEHQKIEYFSAFFSKRMDIFERQVTFHF